MRDLLPVHFGLSVALNMSGEEESETEPEESVVWGWQRFFEEVHTVQETVMRQYGTANERYAHYAVERLATCVQAVSGVRDHLNGPSSLPSENERVVVSHYVHMLDELVSCLRGYWEVYIDEMNRGSSDVAYRSPVVGLPRRGRPAFEIPQEQLEYLASLI